MKKTGFAILFLLFGATVYAQVQSFFALPQPVGKASVRLYPTENVSPGASMLVTFGLPFPRESITTAGLAKVRVLKGTQEIPAFVQQLSPWRHMTNPNLNGTSVRVARIQIHYTFTARFPSYETIIVEWGSANRTKNVSTFVNPRSGWHLVTTGTFVATDQVYEPDVYAVFPKEVLAQGVLRPGRMDPFESSVLEKRDSPVNMRTRQIWPRFLEQEHAAKNNFYSLINEDDPRVGTSYRCDYKNANPDTSGEPWLYDRSSSMFVLYFRSGFFRALREAVRSAEYYRMHIDPQGIFTLKGEGDSKYSYNECLAYAYWLTGDAMMAGKIPLIVKGHRNTQSRWTPELNFWTERHAAFKLLATVVAFEVTGNAAYRTATQKQISDFVWHQNGAGGLLPANRVDGGLYHYGWQHDYDWPENQFGGSSWMTVLLVDAMVRAHAFNETASISDFIRRAGNFERATCHTTADHLYEYGPLLMPMYTMLFDGKPGYADSTDVEHALDVASAIAWAGYFAKLNGNADPALKTSATGLYKTYNVGVNYWIRPDAPGTTGDMAFRVAPWRKYGWEHRVSGSLSWLMKQL